jgi:hypothetical protein
VGFYLVLLGPTVGALQCAAQQPAVGGGGGGAGWGAAAEAEAERRPPALARSAGSLVLADQWLPGGGGHLRSLMGGPTI